LAKIILNILGLIDEENENDSEIDKDDNDMGSDEEDDDDNENSLNNDMSDLKEDDESSDNEETNKVAEETDKNKSINLFTQKLKEKKVIMDEARKQLPYTFTGNDFKLNIKNRLTITKYVCNKHMCYYIIICLLLQE